MDRPRLLIGLARTGQLAIAIAREFAAKMLPEQGGLWQTILYERAVQTPPTFSATAKIDRPIVVPTNVAGAGSHDSFRQTYSTSDAENPRQHHPLRIASTILEAVFQHRLR